MNALPHLHNRGISAPTETSGVLSGIARGALLLLIFAAFVAPAAAQNFAALEVLVVSRESQRPLSGASVSLPQLGLGGLTDRTGHLLLSPVPAGTAAVEISLLGYGTQRVTVAMTAGETTTLQVPMSVQAVELEGVEVTAEAREESVPRLDRAGYYARRRFNPGTFFGPTDMQHRRTVGGKLSDLLRGAVGLYLQPMPGGGYAAYSSRSRGVSTDPCPLPVFIDGVRQIPERRPPDPSREQPNRLNPDLSQSEADRLPTDIDRMMALMDIDAIEVYSGRGTPLQFQVPPVCGAVVIWTRSGPR